MRACLRACACVRVRACVSVSVFACECVCVQLKSRCTTFKPFQPSLQCPLDNVRLYIFICVHADKRQQTCVRAFFK